MPASAAARSDKQVLAAGSKGTPLMGLDREQVMAALRTVKDPELFKDIVTLNMVKDVKIDGSRVDVHVELTTPACPLKDVIEKDVKAALQRAGAQEVKVQFSANTRGAPGP